MVVKKNRKCRAELESLQIREMEMETGMDWRWLGDVYTGGSRDMSHVTWAMAT